MSNFVICDTWGSEEHARQAGYYGPLDFLDTGAVSPKGQRETYHERLAAWQNESRPIDPRHLTEEYRESLAAVQEEWKRHPPEPMIMGMPVATHDDTGKIVPWRPGQISAEGATHER